MPTLSDAVALLEELCPPELAEEWDNVGLLVGDSAGDLRSVLTCLTLTTDVVDEAIASGVDLVVSHHPLPFHGVKRLTTDDDAGDRLWRLARAGIAVYSPHTAYDSAAGGINQQWADRLGLEDATPLLLAADRTDGAGVGRIGTWAVGGGFAALVETVKQAVNLASVRVVVPAEEVSKPRVAIACGSGGSLLDLALSAGSQVFLTGEMGFHECLRCRSAGVGVVLTGHHASERFAVETLAEKLAASLPGVSVSASRVESNPLETA